ncbi:DUF998 domain-containing protein [Glutamicibacter sp.]
MKMLDRAKICRTALRVGAVAYSSGMLAEALLGWKLDPRVTLLSELAARDREHRRLFQVLDLGAGGLFISAGITVRGAGSKWLGTWLEVFGAATIGDALSPLDYPISHEHLRPGHAQKSWTPSISHTMHYATTTVAGVAAAGICLEHWKMQRSEQDPDGLARILRTGAGPAVGVLLLSETLTVVFPKLLPGVVQRVQTLAFSALCLDLASLDVAKLRN